jgi:alkylated DNA repair dioxygenase AlkB
MGKMDLFTNKTTNLLPYGGTVNYYGKIMPVVQADRWMARLLDQIEWRNDEAIIFGRRIITKRKVAWYGDEYFEYTYSNTVKRALPWTAGLLELKGIAENISGETFNSCLLNLYHDGNEGMAWHSDDEKI